MVRNISVSQPLLGDEETAYVTDALAKGAISGYYGEYLSRFEQEFSHYCDCDFGVSVSGGTPALHLAMATLNIVHGDEILVSTLTNMATIFSILYQGAIPVLVDIEADTLNLNPELLDALVTPQTKAILVVHLFGHPVDMSPVMATANKYGLYVVEDCAQAHGATYNGKKVGSIGDIGCFSFYANKIITTGEGGMLTTNDSKLADRARDLKSLAFGDHNKFMHKDIGFNYRMTNLQAALGCAQITRIETIIAAKRHIAAFYQEKFRNILNIRLPIEKSYARSVYWMYQIVLTGPLVESRERIMSGLKKQGIDTREGFIAANMQEIFIEKGLTSVEKCPIAAAVSYSSFYIPSGPMLNSDELEYVAEYVGQVLGRAL